MTVTLRMMTRLEWVVSRYGNRHTELRPKVLAGSAGHTHTEDAWKSLSYYSE